MNYVQQVGHTSVTHSLSNCTGNVLFISLLYLIWRTAVYSNGRCWAQCSKVYARRHWKFNTIYTKA